MSKSSLTVLDLFSGAGGWSLGFHRKGFKIVGGVEIWGNAVKVFESKFRRRSAGHVLVEDITKISPHEIRKEFGEVDIIVSSPPCQGFSSARNFKKDAKTNDLTLVHKTLELLEKLNPRFHIMENVKRVYLLSKTDPLLKGFIERYQLRREIIECAEYGLPQFRKRTFIGNIPKPPRTHANIQTTSRPLDEFLEISNNKHTVNDLKPYETAGKFLEPVGHDKIRVHLRNKLLNKELAAKKRLFKVFSPTFIFPDRPSPTVLASWGKADNVLVQDNGFKNPPEIVRALEILGIDTSKGWGHVLPVEAARLQSFPGNYFSIPKLSIGKQDLFRLIGNAVPPLVGEVFATSVLHYLKNFP